MLLSTAPHVVTPCPASCRSAPGPAASSGSIARFLRMKSKLKDRGFLITALGLRLYDAYARSWRAMPTHRMLTNGALRREMPDLDPGIIGAGLYYEGQLSYAERLAVELVLDGLALNPESRAVNHAELLAPDGDVLSYRYRGQVHAARA